MEDVARLEEQGWDGGLGMWVRMGLGGLGRGCWAAGPGLAAVGSVFLFSPTNFTFSHKSSFFARPELGNLSP